MSKVYKNISTNIDKSIQLEADEEKNKHNRKEVNIQLAKDELLVGPPTDVMVSKQKVISGSVAALDPAQQRAEDLILSAKQQVEMIEREAYHKAFELGEKAGKEIGEKKLEPIIKSLSSILADFASFKETLFRTYEREIIELSMNIAEKIIYKELDQDNEIIFNIVTEAVQQAINENEIIIKISQTDYEQIMARQEKLMQSIASNKQVTIEVLDSLNRGDCIIETNSGAIEATIPGRLNNIKDKLV